MCQLGGLFIKPGDKIMERNNYSYSELLLKKENYIFFKDNLKKEFDSFLLCEKAKEYAGIFGKKRISNNQIRRYYNEIKMLEHWCDDSCYEIIIPHLKMLKIRVYYAFKRRSKKTPEELKQFIENLVNSIADKKDLKAAALFFEAIVGYSYFYNEK